MPPLTFKSHGDDITLEHFAGAGVGPRPAIVVVYGTRGMNSPFGESIRSFAGKLAASGCTAFIPHYMETTKTAASTNLDGDAVVMTAVQTHRDTWIGALGDCLADVAARSDVRSDRLGMLGFSMGGHLTLRAAKGPRGKAVQAVVSFFAPINQWPFNGLGGDIDKLPPLQIHHGSADGPPVSPAESRALESLLVAAGKVKDRDYEIHFYEGQGHVFTGEATKKSEARTVDFFGKRLAGP